MKLHGLVGQVKGKYSTPGSKKKQKGEHYHTYNVPMYVLYLAMQLKPRKHVLPQKA